LRGKKKKRKSNVEELESQKGRMADKRGNVRGPAGDRNTFFQGGRWRRGEHSDTWERIFGSGGKGKVAKKSSERKKRFPKIGRREGGA